MEMNENTKLEVAKEIIFEKVGKAVTERHLTINDQELVDLIYLKRAVNSNDKEAIDFVLNNMSTDSKTSKTKASQTISQQQMGE